MCDTNLLTEDCFSVSLSGCPSSTTQSGDSTTQNFWQTNHLKYVGCGLKLKRMNYFVTSVVDKIILVFSSLAICIWIGGSVLYITFESLHFPNSNYTTGLSRTGVKPKHFHLMQTWITGRMFSFFKNALGARARFASTFSASHCFLGLMHAEKENHTNRKVQKFLERHSLQRAEGSATRQASTPTAAARTPSHSEIQHAGGWRSFFIHQAAVGQLSSASPPSLEDHLQDKRSSARREDI